VEGESTSGSCNTPQNFHIGFAGGALAGEIGNLKPLAVTVSLMVAPMSTPQI
jgi:hypothetical protein